jgi:RNA-splicing ligase RtcB
LTVYHDPQLHRYGSHDPAEGFRFSAKGEKLLIPINMRDGSLICIGKGNPDWNCSAPHGAGRLMSRKDAFAHLSLEQFQAEMDGIYTTCVSRDTLDRGSHGL